MGSGRRRPDATDSSGAPAARGMAARSRRTRRAVLLAVLGALALSGVLAQPALATRKVNIVFSCATTTFEYSGFPELEHNQVTERLRADGVSEFIEKFEFNGSTGTSVVPMPVALAAGLHKLSAEAHWNTNGVVGESGKHKEHKSCGGEPKPSFSVLKAQQIAGSSGGWTQTALNGKLGQTVEYQMTVSNTGNVAFTLTEFLDPNCDPGTQQGGPVGASVAPGDKLVFTCSHLLTGGGSYTNVASATAKYSQGGSESHKSNTVVVNVVLEPRLTLSKVQEIKGSGSGFTASLLTGTVGQTVLYQITAKNTGNVPLTLSEFTDIYCDEHTISGGLPSGTPLAPGDSTTYGCSARLKEIPENGKFLNVASVADTPSGGGSTETTASNAVEVKVKAAEAPGQQTTSTTGGGTTGSGGGSTGTLGGTKNGSTGSTGDPKNSTLGAKSSKKHHHTVTVEHKTPKFTG